ncbi:MAG: Nif3-like dinuclear metal center hexameric protein [Crocinitomicaceae bacterium]|nr:Nif3-like dinuclear metal center hexameric protein [Crocinitomicaceae bacterium]
MLLKEITEYLEQKAPLALQENYDNCGLITGDLSSEINSALICLDSTEDVVDEAIAIGCNLIIAHHPIIFSGLKKFSSRGYIERAIVKAIKNDIAIYAIHTNLDNASNGVNQRMADKLGLISRKILDPKADQLLKLSVFVPETHADALRNALFVSGAGHIGGYDECSFGVSGEGTFRAGENSLPFVGKRGQRHTEREIKIEVILRAWNVATVISAMNAAHPYEEVAYDLYPLKNKDEGSGSGLLGELPEALPTKTFLKLVKDHFTCEVVRHTALHKETIKNVALCGGSGSFLLPKAIGAKADIFITADFKYHQFFDADKKIILADIGHFESEQFTIDLLSDWIAEKFPNFAAHKTGVVTNPIYYF